MGEATFSGNVTMLVTKDRKKSGKTVSAGSPRLNTELGLMRLFGTEDIDRQGLVSGWAEPEDAHVWNNGPVAALSIAMNIPDEPCRLVVEGEPFVSSRQPMQEITLYGNGIWLGFWRLRNAEPSVMEALVEPETFFRRGEEGVLNLAWYIPTSVRPSDIGVSGDGRELGFVFRTLVVKSS